MFWPATCGGLDLPDADPTDGVCLTTDVTCPCSLRAAVEQSNALPGPDEIVLVPATGEEYRLGLGALRITDGVTLRSVQGEERPRLVGADDRIVVQSIPPEQNPVILRGVTLTGGRAPGSAPGGAILLEAGTLELDEVRVENNDAPGGVGGGIAVLDARLVVTDSTFTGNGAEEGGGAWIGPGADATFDRSTLSDNAATLGAGVAVRGGRIELTNSSVARNVASGSGGGIAVLAPDAAAVLRSVTVVLNEAANAGGVHNAARGDLLATNLLLGENSATDTNPDLTGRLESLGHVLVELPADAEIISRGDGDLLGADPGALALASNGGPTLTVGIPAGSAARDAGDPATCERLEQRGFARSLRADGTCDIGAFEGAPCSGADTLDGDGIPDDCDPCPTDVDNDSDDDGVCADGDGDGVPGSNPCPPGVTVGCDDNCPLDPNPEQRLEACELAAPTLTQVVAGGDATTEGLRLTFALGLTPWAGVAAVDDCGVSGDGLWLFGSGLVHAFRNPGAPLLLHVAKDPVTEEALLNWEGAGERHAVHRDLAPDGSFLEIGRTTTFTWRDAASAERLFYCVLPAP